MMGTQVERCIVTVTEDQDFSVTELENKLKSHYDIVQCMALGSTAFVEYHESRLENSVSPLSLSAGFSTHHIFITSINALLELGNTLDKFKNVTFWIDPNDLASSGNTFGNNESTSPLDLIHSTISSALSNFSNTGIVARSEAGRQEWKQVYGIDVDVVTDTFLTVYEDSSCEPLIEKRDQLRFLIDANGCHTTVSLVEPFLVLQESFPDIELWCHYNGELPLWMRPDFLIQEIPSLEKPLYTNSVDALVSTGNTLDAKKTMQYLALGLVPIVIDEHLAEELGNIIDTTIIKASFPSFGSEALLHELAESAEKLELYNSYSHTRLKTNLIFNSNKIVSHSVSTENYKTLLLSNVFNKARKLYLESTYGDAKGTQLHRSLELVSRHIGSAKGNPSSLVTFRGWCLDTETPTGATPITLQQGEPCPCLVRRTDRADVADAYQLDKSTPLGFESILIPNDGIQTDEVQLAIADDDGTLAPLDVFESSLKKTVNITAQLEQNGALQDTSHLKGVLENIDTTDVIGIELTDLQLDCNALILKLMHHNTALDLTRLELYLSYGKKLLRLESDDIDAFKEYVTVKFDEGNSACFLYIKEQEPGNTQASDISCQAYSITAEQIEQRSQEHLPSTSAIDSLITEAS